MSTVTLNVVLRTQKLTVNPSPFTPLDGLDEYLLNIKLSVNELCDNSSFCLGSKSGFFSKELINKQASMTGGLVGQSEHLIFPAVPPIITVMLTLSSVLVRCLDYLVCCAYTRTSLMTICNEN